MMCLQSFGGGETFSKTNMAGVYESGSSRKRKWLISNPSTYGLLMFLTSAHSPVHLKTLYMFYPKTMWKGHKNWKHKLWKCEFVQHTVRWCASTLTKRQNITHTSLMLTVPCSTVPVRTVPWPRTLKQWSTAKRNGLEAWRSGTNANFCSVSTRSCSPVIQIKS